jgi:ERCC4-type nuclease|uniref:ERCC4 domain-containing protein n=1 Tax=viral metagenome TaxID=1070528 RepID=A0A6C0ILN1_9ZZZZ
MKLVIDCREKDLLKQINQQVLFTHQFKKIEVVSENLPIGDILIKDDSNNDLVIIERKTIPDLLSSIKDGRYEEQSYRLNGIKHPNHNIMYLIEGDTNNKKYFQKVDKMMFYSALLSLNYYKGFSVIKTQNLTETAIFICNSLIKIQKNNCLLKQPFYKNIIVNNESNDDTETDDNLKQDGALIKMRKDEILEIATLSEEEQPEEKDYVHVVKKVKKENVTTNNIDEIMLSQVPGISSTTAIAIIQKFKSIKNIVESCNNFIKEVQPETITKELVCKELFNDIFYINSKGDRRKITKTSINNLYQYLLENK